MSPAKKNAPAPKTPAASKWNEVRTQALQAALGHRARTVVLLMIVLGGSALMGHWLWKQIGHQITARDDYQLDPRNIQVTPQPAYIRADVKAEVVRDSSLDQNLSMLDDQLAQRVAEAFAFHPWVARVEQVRKAYPGQIHVDLVYRRPVVMVSLEGGANLELLPVDAEGVHLPSSDFSPLEKRRFPRLVGIDALPLVGQKSTDPRVVGGAQLAAYLHEVWQPFNLARIVPLAATATDRERFELITRHGARIIWGAAPGAEPEGEPKADAKLAKLRAHVKQHGSLDAPGQTELNVREAPRVPTSIVK